ncbi:MAG: hypothetical protein ACUVQ1_06285 [Candidatus Kapaibacteriales bacterium]
MKIYPLYFFLLYFIFSCASPRIQVRNISDYQEIPIGDTAKIYWDFLNAKYVKISGDNRIFAPKDSITFTVNNSIRFEIIAYQSERDSLSQYVYVVASFDKPLPELQKVQRGPDLIPNLLQLKSEESSEYLCGFFSSPFNLASQLKILRTKLNLQKDSINIDFIILDKNGNLLYDLRKYSGDILLDIYQSCTSAESYRRTMEFPVELYNSGKINVHLLLEKNFLNTFTNFKDDLLDAVKYLANDDGFSLSIFGVELKHLIQFQNFDKAYWQIKNTSFNSNIELTATFKSLIELMDKIPEDKNNIIILIGQSNDNSSIVYTYDDVIKKANEKKITIYSVLVGNECSPALFQYISNQTFGGFYHLLWVQPKQISKIIGEIILSNKYYYSIVFPNQFKEKKCKEISYKIVARQGLNQISNSFSIPATDKSFYIDFQAVSIYKFLDTNVSNEYFPVLLQLANLLKNYPEVSVELIGNASIDEISFQPELISFSRANNVRKELITLGVNPTQITIKARGTTKPLFQIEDDELTKILNRRTEIRWLHPSVLPYTIVVNTLESEELAEKEISIWEKRGFKAYYDRILNKGELAYRVILWGYSDFKTAEKTARAIAKKFGIQTLIE